MERGNTKHGALLDERMAQETRGNVRGTAGGRAEEWKTPEPAGEDQPEVTFAPGGYGRGVPAGIGSVEGEAFSRFGSYIGLSAFPGNRAALESSARTLEAPDDVMRRLAALPDGQIFENAAQAWEASEGRNA
ncbi:DUF2795 domain-containing protein [Actinoplanes flavus]|uniref:DUF2795 domain-containing protein n=1 Tax=Actinoplanes flavus TaxID=2820290 RepID=A0ABS3UV26_9ACTN|nr:DUF2795 domain-containing protein [Actinoplanes flavus]MBO3742428.1 DUF2795 domain-containing protein [Actinoplanes flavus]